MAAHSPRAMLEQARIVFWDFDGVIKESVEVKTRAFEMLFEPFGTTLATRVRQHHEANTGLSRFQKLPLYLEWAGQPVTPELVHAYCDRFAGLVKQAVIDSAWVAGVREYILENRLRQRFVLVTATPQDEIESIMRAVGLIASFEEIHGAPTTKWAAVADVLQRSDCPPTDALVVGDAGADMDAALANGVPFLLRRTPINGDVQRRHAGPSFDDLRQR